MPHNCPPPRQPAYKTPELSNVPPSAHIEGTITQKVGHCWGFAQCPAFLLSGAALLRPPPPPPKCIKGDTKFSLRSLETAAERKSECQGKRMIGKCGHVSGCQEWSPRRDSPRYVAAERLARPECALVDCLRHRLNVRPRRYLGL